MNVQLTSTEGVQPPSAITSPSETQGQAAKSGFSEILAAMMKPDAQNRVNEEQLFSALIQERLGSKIGDDAATQYREMFEQLKVDLQRGDGYIPVEEAAKRALAGMVGEGTLSREQAAEIEGQAFTAAQLDDNHSALYDSRGSTVAVAMVTLALQSAEEKIQSIEDGTLGIHDTSGAEGIIPSVGPQGSGFVGGDGFLFKPVSEGDGNLVVLLPANMADGVNAVTLLDSSGNVIESGQQRENFDDGRPVFRFDQPGGAYPDGLTVSIQLAAGGEKQYLIPESSARWE